MHIVQLTGRQLEERESAARFEVYAQNRLLACCIDHKGLRMRTAQQTAAKAPEAVSILPVIHANRVFA
jgi:hypothetical protein